LSQPTDRISQSEAVGLSLTDIASSGIEGRVNRELIAGLGESGLLDLIYSGDGVTAVDLCAIRQGLARTNTTAETALALQGLGGFPIHLSGSKETREQWIPRIKEGSVVAAFALTEPGAGSDAGSLAMTATRDGEGFRLTGDKAYISNAPDADVYSLFASTDPGGRSRGITAFAVPGDAEGLSGESIAMISPHPIGRIHLENVYVPDSAILGEINQGFGVAMKTLDLFRPSVGAFALGMAEAALREAVSHAANREAFGKKIQEFQGVSHQLANVRVAIEAASHLVYSAARAHDEGDTESLTGKAAMAKLAATETAQTAVDVAIQVLGARGLEADSPLAHLYLEVRAPRIYEGTSEIQRNIIARELFTGRI
jgi:alkylation response protein AidB-like acyl-CoA dehydrogenase